MVGAETKQVMWPGVASLGNPIWDWVISQAIAHPALVTEHGWVAV